MGYKIKSDDADFLFQAILKLENMEECYRFFEDLCTVTEIKSISQRIVVAKMLKDKKVYNTIGEATGASTATIGRVNRTLQYGAEGYGLILDRLEAEETQQNEE